jgi:type IV pilus assembly protein PilM
MSHHILGLDIGSHTIKVVEMSGGKGGLRLLNFATMPTPPGVIQQGVISDPQTLGQSIKQLLTGKGIKTKQVVSSVAGQTSLVVRIIEIPRAAPSELKEMVPYEIDRYTPFADTEPVFSWEVVERPGADPTSPNIEILFAAAQPDMIEAHVETLQAAGLQPQAIDVEPLAVGRPFTHVPGGPDGVGETIAFIDLGAASTEVSIIKDGLLHFPRTIPIGGDALTRSIAEGLGVHEHQAERLKREHGAVLREPPPVYREEEAVRPSATLGTYSRAGGTLDEVTEVDFGFNLADTAAEEETSGLDLSFDLGRVEVEEEAESAPVFDLTLDTVEEEAPPVAAEGGGVSFSLEDTNGGLETAPPAAPAFNLEATPEVAEEEVSFLEPEGALSFDLSEGSTEGGVSFVEEDTSGPVFELLPESEEESTGTAFDLTGGGPEVEAMVPTGDLEDTEGRVAEEEAGALAEAADSLALSQQVYGCMEPVLNELVTEIRRSLEYYQNRHDNAGIDRIVLVGGTARLRGLDAFLQEELGVRVEIGNPVSHLIVDNPALAEDLPNHAPALAISVGLAMHQLID